MPTTLFLALFLLGATQDAPTTEVLQSIPQPHDPWEIVTGPPGEEKLELHAAIEEVRSGALPMVRLTLKNVGTRDTLVNLGAMLGNGSILVPTLELLAADDAGETHYRYVDPKHVSVEGLLLDDLVPLPVGSTYSFPVDMANFVTGAGWSKLPLPEKPYRVVFVFKAHHVVEERSAILWIFSGELHSNELTLSPSTSSPGETRQHDGPEGRSSLNLDIGPPR